MNYPNYHNIADIRQVVQTYDIQTPVENVKEQSVYFDGSIRIAKKDVSKHMRAGAKDTVCVFYLEDGSILIMEQGLAKERLKDEYGEIIRSKRNKN